MIKVTERIVVTKRRKEKMVLSRSAVFIRLAKTGNKPGLFLKKPVMVKHASATTPVIRWIPSQTTDDPIVLPNREYGKMMRLLENPPPFNDFLLQLMSESKRVFNNECTSAGQ